MSGAGFDLAGALTDVADQLAAVEGIRSASADPAKVAVPGVWVQCTGFEVGSTLAGSVNVNLRLLLVTGQRDHMRAVVDLSDLYNLVAGQLPATGAITPAVAALNGGDLPALAYPTRVRWTPDPA